jgi:hypothetical protein
MGKKPVKKLQLKKETIRTLCDADLVKVNGGLLSGNCSTGLNDKCPNVP